MSKLPTRYSRGEEIANVITHALGVLLSIAGVVLLATFAAINGNAWHVVASTIYGGSQLLLYLTSTLYHWVERPDTKARLRLLDHSAIFLLIAGTYTPFTLVSLNGPWGWTVFGISWGLALIGIGLQPWLIKRGPVVTALPYVGMGWVIVIVLDDLIDVLPSGGLWLLVAGGLSYTLGTGFYVAKRMPYHHAIWHLFVLGGSVTHFLAVFLYVIP